MPLKAPEAVRGSRNLRRATVRVRTCVNFPDKGLDVAFHQWVEHLDYGLLLPSLILRNAFSDAGQPRAGFRRQLQELRTEMMQRTSGMLTGAGMGSVKVLVDL